MIPCRPVPLLPIGIVGFTEQEQVALIANIWTVTVDNYATCSERQRGLVEWINNGP